jgi:Ca-activated chloride channel family protein
MVTMLPAAPSFARPRAASPALSASRSVMAGSMLGITVARAPMGARLAIARPDDLADRAIIVLPLPAGGTASLLTPGEPGLYELRLTQDRDGSPIILLRQPLAITPASATVTGPTRVARGNVLPVRGIGPNGVQDRVTIVPKDAAADVAGPSFFPFENVEATLEAPDDPGLYELRYVMHAPLAENRILARQTVTVE